MKIKLLVAICSVSVIFSCKETKTVETKEALPNIVFYISDDLSASDISLYNESGIDVPNINQLASEGLTFNNAFIASPACAPSRSALLTGLFPARNGAQVNHSYPHKNTLKLPTLLQKMGYEVISFGKVGHGFNEKQAAAYGFDHFSGKPTDLPNQVRTFFKDRKSTKPICLLVGDRRPHVTWIKKANYPLDNVVLPSIFIDTKETREHWARYATDVQGMDKDLGNILSLSKAMFGDDYVFLFSADHGSQWPFGKWNLYDYGIHVPLVVSSPKLTKKGSKTEAMVSWVDIFPTLIDMAGGKVPDDIDGKSFAKVLENPKESHRDFIYTTHSGDGDFNVYPIRSIRTERFKYIHNLFPENLHTNHSDILRKDGAGAYWNSWDEAAKADATSKAITDKYFVRPEFEFFDLKNDPKEQNNLAGKEAFNDEQDKLKQILETMNIQQKDSLKIIGEPHPISLGRPNKETIDKRKNKKH
tara:strand:- start:19826 stop:21244 length:1419 start_codon:yes stop_codon:yes gene_type:complete